MALAPLAGAARPLMRAVLIACAALLFAGCGFKIPPCVLDGSCLPQPSPSPSPAPSPSPTAEPLPTPSPSPAPTPAPSPSPVSTPSPSPRPVDGPPPLDANGNYPIPPAGTCPAHFAGSLYRYGIQEHSRRPCSGNCQADGYLGIVIIVSATPKSVPPYCGHAGDRRECEQWRPCQDGYADWQDASLGPALYMTLPGHWVDARVVKRSDNNHLGIHKPTASETGVMTFKACPRGARPDDPRCGVSKPVSVP